MHQANGKPNKKGPERPSCCGFMVTAKEKPLSGAFTYTPCGVGADCSGPESLNQIPKHLMYFPDSI